MAQPTKLVFPKVDSATALSATPNPAIVGQTVTFGASVTGANATPQGTVTFSVNGTSIGAAPVDGSGVASLAVSTSGVPPGTYPVVATYGGNNGYFSSKSSAVNLVLQQPQKYATTTTLSAAPNPVTPPANVTLVAAVRHSAQGISGAPTGSVTFYYGTTAIGTASLNESADASITASTNGLATGSYAVTVKYGGDSTDTASTSAPLTVKVN